MRQIMSNIHTKCTWKINTSNSGKLQEFQRLFAAYGIQLLSTSIDLQEIVADPLSVVAHKASQLEEFVLVEDSSLEVEGAAVGIHVRWLLEHLEEYIGHKALWTVLLAYRQGKEVLIYKGEVQGKIVQARGTQGFGFDPVFLPLGATLTLAEAKPDAVNARAKAVEAFMKNERLTIVKTIDRWDGCWQ